MKTTDLPEFIFFTGVPGSKWSGISQILEQNPQINTSDRTVERRYQHAEFSGHMGAYFGAGMEFEPILDRLHLLQAWQDSEPGHRVVKSHDWAYMLDDIVVKFPDQWIMLVWRENQISYDWWQQAGGFSITYPNYSAYVDNDGMHAEIARQNQGIEAFARLHDLKWSEFSSAWVEQNFGFKPEMKKTFEGIYAALWRSA